jgi:hypothetical protein
VGKRCKKIRELEAVFEDKVGEFLAEANDAGYGMKEATGALLKVIENQANIAENDPDPAGHPPNAGDSTNDSD